MNASMTTSSATISAHATDTASMDVHATTKFLTITPIAVEMSTFHHQKTKNVSSSGKTKLKNAETTALLSLNNVSSNVTKTTLIAATFASTRMPNALVNAHVMNNVQMVVLVQFSKISPISVQPLNPFHPNVPKIGPTKSKNATTIATTPTTNVFVTVVTPICHNVTMNVQ